MGYIMYGIYNKVVLTLYTWLRLHNGREYRDGYFVALGWLMYESSHSFYYTRAA